VDVNAEDGGKKRKKRNPVPNFLSINHHHQSSHHPVHNAMTKEEVAASLERMEDDPDDWYGECALHQVAVLLTRLRTGTRESSVQAVLVGDETMCIGN
jgi:hypothetical protein